MKPYLVRQLTLEPVDLPFRPDALAPWLSPGSVAAHYRQYRRYCEKARELAFEFGREAGRLEDVVRWAATHARDLRRLPAEPQVLLGRLDRLFEQSAQAWSHAFLWLCFDTPRAGAHTERAMDLCSRFERKLVDAAVSSFGSGWVWLVRRGGRIDVEVTRDAWTPIVEPGAVPLLVVDVWEHAYFMDYSFDRARYAREVVELLDWEFAADALYGQAG